MCYSKREQTQIPCKECNCKLTRVIPAVPGVNPYYICAKCTALYFEDNPKLKDVQTEDSENTS